MIIMIKMIMMITTIIMKMITTIMIIMIMIMIMIITIMIIIILHAPHADGRCHRGGGWQLSPNSTFLLSCFYDNDNNYI